MHPLIIYGVNYRQERAIRFQQETVVRETAQMKAKAEKQAAQAEADAKRTAAQRFLHYDTLNMLNSRHYRTFSFHVPYLEIFFRCENLMAKI